MKKIKYSILGSISWFFIMSFICGTINFLGWSWLARLFYVLVGLFLIAYMTDNED